MPSEHRTYRSLWYASAHLETTVRTSEEGSTYAQMGSVLCLYFALEGFLNDLGERVAPDIWSKEQEFFSKGEFRGTIGKLGYLAKLNGFAVDRSRRPYQSVKQLEKVRHDLVHPRTVREQEPTRFDQNGRPLLVEPQALLTVEQPEFLVCVRSDVQTLADNLLAAAKRNFEVELDDFGERAFEGAISAGFFWLPYVPPTNGTE